MPVNVSNIRFADESDTGKTYRVYPINRDERLAKIVEIDEDENEVGEPFRVQVGDLFEFYTLRDHQGKVLSEPPYGDHSDFGYSTDAAMRTGSHHLRAAIEQLAGDSVRVYNLSTQEEQWFSGPPEQAVIAAYTHSKGDHNTWDYEEKYGHLVEHGKYVVVCGDWAALVRKPEPGEKLFPGKKEAGIKRLGPNQTVVMQPNKDVFYSYDTPVAVYDGRLYVTTQKFSNTTSRHIKVFLGMHADVEPTMVSQQEIEQMAEG